MPDSTKDLCSSDHPLHRPVQVLLPPGWHRNPARKFPVIYANDGQDMGRWNLRETVERMITGGRIEPLIVVMIPASRRRAHEYGVAGKPNARGMGNLADEYTSWLLNHLKPCIDRQYPTTDQAEQTAIMGASLGGLSAFDIAWNHPTVFGIAGAFSGSFWWRTDNSSPARKQASRIVHQMVRDSGSAPDPRPRLWFQAGLQDESEDRDENGVIDSIQDVAELMEELENVGYVNGQDMEYVETDGGHNPATWAEALEEFLVWGFPSSSQ